MYTQNTLLKQNKKHSSHIIDLNVLSKTDFSSHLAWWTKHTTDLLVIKQLIILISLTDSKEKEELQALAKCACINDAS